MKILVPMHSFINWNGGLDLIRLLMAVLTAGNINSRVQIVFAVPKFGLYEKTLLPLIRAWQLRSAKVAATLPNGRQLPSIAQEIIGNAEYHTCGKGGHDIAKLARTVHADIIFPTLTPIPACNIPRIGYIFDFQHRHLPHLFSQRIIRKRDRQFAFLASNSDALIVNSDFVYDDVIRFLGFDSMRLFKLPFIPFKNKNVPVDTAKARRNYALDAPYLIVCNHFWMHKDHKTALQAFARLVAEPSFADMHLVLTGDPVDHRNPAHYSQLITLADNLGIRKHTHFLGLIPKGDQLSLLCGARALIQPTLYEGGPGGGSVYEALGNNIPTVLSDIKVNREIRDGRVFFFTAGDSENLVACLKRTLQPQDAPSEDLANVDGNAALHDASDSLYAFMRKLVGTA
jgi:glycosyltransferase involved in cell wall biosynthesis